MSRFKAKEYQDVFEWSGARYRLKDKEKVLWKGKDALSYYFQALFIFLCIISIGTLLYILFYESVEETNTLLILLVMSPMIVPILLLIPFGIYYHKKRKAFRKERKPIDTNEFISRSLSLNNDKIDIVKASRDTLGALYKMDSPLIYPEDTPEILDIIKNRRSYLSPYRFEFALGTAKRLGIILSDKDVDRIGSRLSESARTIEQLIKIMCDEMTVAQEQQQEMLGNNTFENKLAEIEQEGPGEKQLKKNWKKKFQLPVIVAVLFFMAGLQILLDRKEQNESNTFIHLLALIALVIFGFIAGGLIQFSIKIINKIDCLRKVKYSIYIAFFCMLAAFAPEKDSQKQSFDSDLLVTVLIAGVCGFLIARIAYRLGKRIETYLDKKWYMPEEERKRIKKELKWLNDKSPSKLYFKSTLSYMIDNHEHQRTIPQTKILSVIEGYDKAEPPLYGELTNWLRELVDLEPRPYQSVQQKTMPLNLGNKKEKRFVNLNVEFADANPQPYLRLQMEDHELTNPALPSS